MNENTERIDLSDEPHLQGSYPDPEKVEAAPAETVSQDPLSTDAPQEEASKEETTAPVESDRDLDLLPSPAEARDPDPLTPPAEGASLPDPRIDQLRREVEELRASLAYHHLDRAEREVRTGEFSSLYPDVTYEDLPDDVIADVRRGVPVAAAYALSERRRILREARAAEINRQNRSRSAGGLGIGETDLFSPAEVRAMTQAEVRANYDKILQSMQTWH